MVRKLVLDNVAEHMTIQPAPTRSELRLLQLLWADGPATVREIHEQVAREAELSYTTVLKQLQIMHEKGLVARETSHRAHRYRAVARRDETQRSMLSDFVQRVYHGSASELVVQALGLSKRASPEELEEIEQMIDTLRKRKGTDSSDDES